MSSTRPPQVSHCAAQARTWRRADASPAREPFLQRGAENRPAPGDGAQAGRRHLPVRFAFERHEIEALRTESCGLCRTRSERKSSPASCSSRLAHRRSAMTSAAMRSASVSLGRRRGPPAWRAADRRAPRGRPARGPASGHRSPATPQAVAAIGSMAAIRVMYPSATSRTVTTTTCLGARVGIAFRDYDRRPAVRRPAVGQAARRREATTGRHAGPAAPSRFSNQ